MRDETIYSDDPEKRRIYLEGAFDMCKLLSTSPRMNRPQLQIIKEQAYKRQDELETLGVKFTESP